MSKKPAAEAKSAGYFYVKVPGVLPIVDDNGKLIRKISFFEFVQERVRDAKYFGTSVDGVLTAVSIEREFREVTAGGIVKLSKRDYDLLAAAVREPSEGYNVRVTMQVTEFLLAVTEATDKPNAAMV